MKNNYINLGFLVISTFLGQHIKAMDEKTSIPANSLFIYIDESIESLLSKCIYLKTNDDNQVKSIQSEVFIDIYPYLKDISDYLLISTNKFFNGPALLITSNLTAEKQPQATISASTCVTTTDSKNNTTISLKSKLTPIIQNSINNVSIYSDSSKQSGLNVIALKSTAPSQQSAATSQTKFNRKFSINLANQSSQSLNISDDTGKKYSISKNKLININNIQSVKLKIISSIEGYLQIGSPTKGTIQVIEYDSNICQKSKYALYYDYDLVPKPTITIYDSPSSLSDSGLIVMMEYTDIKTNQSIS